jgi:Ca-activated chloride channel homolog
MKKFTQKISVLVVLTLLLSSTSSFALGVLFSRPLNSNITYNKMWIKTVDADVQIDGQIGVTYVDQTFKNEMNTVVEAVWVFPLPEGAVVTELFYWFNGVRYKGAIKERQEARNAYEGQIRRMLDPALLEYLGDNLYRLSIAPINANSDVRTEITFVELLPYEFGTIDYTFLLNAVELTPKPLQRISVQTVVETQNPIKYFESPSHGTSTATQITRIHEKKYEVTFGDENFMPDKDLVLQYETKRDQVNVNVVRYTPTVDDSIGNDSWYAVWITPPDNPDNEEIIPQKMVFTADVSSSMEGTRIEQLKQSLLTFLDNLDPNDYFNIITFGTNVVHFQPDLIKATSENIETARAFVVDIGALGLTNINDALTQSLQQSFSSGYANSIVFLTDGHPTWGETFIPDILTNVRANNTNNVSIFTFGVGEDVSQVLLTQLAVENGGYAEYIYQDDDISQKISNHFKRISKPVLADLDIKIEGLVTSDKFPRPLPDLYWGNQVLQLGIYKNSGEFPVYLNGQVRDKNVSYRADATFSNIPGGHRFVPRLWAKAKIDFLMDQIDIYGEIDELVDQIIELSLKFQILTKYTAFYADPNAPGTAVEENENVEMPDGFVLHQNYPNPFNPTTTIKFELPTQGHVLIKIFDLTGRLVKVLVDKEQNAGAFSVQWDGTDLFGNTVAAGVYIYQLEFVNRTGTRIVKSRKMSLVK